MEFANEPAPASTPQQEPGWYDDPSDRVRYQRHWDGSRWGARRMRSEVMAEEQMRLLYSMDASLKRVSFGVTLWMVLTFLALLPVGLSLLGLLSLAG